MNDRSPIVLNDIPIVIQLESVLRKIHVGADDPNVEQISNMIEGAQAAARPKALYREAYIDARSDGSVVIDGITFTSRVLSVNLEDVHKVFPFIATCGREIDEWSRSFDDLLERFWADAIKEIALGAATHALGQHMEKRFSPGSTSSMNPGSLEDWPLDQQAPMFELLGDPTAAIGVQLTDSFLMLPTKSVSGIIFATEVKFENCQLCQRENCPGRRAKYDENLYANKYASKDDPHEQTG